MRWMQGSRGEEYCGCDGCKILAERKTTDALYAWMHGSRGEEDCGYDGCKVLGEHKTAVTMDARF